MVVQEQLYTADNLANMPDDKRYALIEGWLIEMSPTGEMHGRLTNWLGYLITGFVVQHDLGQVYGAKTGFKLAENPDTVLGVDVAFVSKSRLRPVDEGYFVGAPDLVIEVISPGNTKTEIHEKVVAYFRAGARLVLAVYPKSRVIYVYRSVSDVRILSETDTLDGGDVLPGFSVPIAEIFKVLK